MADPFIEYTGMSYEQASREAQRLMQSSVKVGRLFDDLPERLAALRERMRWGETSPTAGALTASAAVLEQRAAAVAPDDMGSAKMYISVAHLLRRLEEERATDEPALRLSA